MTAYYCSIGWATAWPARSNGKTQGSDYSQSWVLHCTSNVLVKWFNYSFSRSREPKKAGRPGLLACVNLKWGPNWNQLFHWDAGMRPEHHDRLTRIEWKAGGVDKRMWISRWASDCFPLHSGDNLVLFCTCSSLGVDVTDSSVTEEDCGNTTSSRNPAKENHRDKELMYTDAFTDSLLSLYCVDLHIRVLHDVCKINENSFQQHLKTVVKLNVKQWTMSGPLSSVDQSFGSVCLETRLRVLLSKAPNTQMLTLDTAMSWQLFLGLDLPSPVCSWDNAVKKTRGNTFVFHSVLNVFRTGVIVVFYNNDDWNVPLWPIWNLFSLWWVFSFICLSR